MHSCIQRGCVNNEFVKIAAQKISQVKNWLRDICLHDIIIATLETETTHHVGLYKSIVYGSCMKIKVIITLPSNIYCILHRSDLRYMNQSKHFTYIIDYCRWVIICG